MLLALATCENLPGWEVDDLPFQQALSQLDISIERPIWDDPTIDWSRYDAIIIRTTWDYQEKQERFVAWAKKVSAQTLLLNPVEVVEWNTRKTYLRDLEAMGAPLAPTEWLECGSSVDLQHVLVQRGWERAFIKPVVGATARETLRFGVTAPELAVAQAHLDRLLPTESMILQPYMSSVETEGELSAVFFGGEFSHGVQKIPVPGDYRVQDDFGASDRPYTFTAREWEMVERISKALEQYVETRLGAVTLLYARIDLLRDGEGNLCLNELELVEPSLFFRHDPQSGMRFAKAILQYIQEHRRS